MPSAEEHVQGIRAETKRRNAIWKAMQEAGKEVVGALRKESKRQGVKLEDWFDKKGVAVLYYSGGDGQNITYRRVVTLLPSGKLEELTDSNRFSGPDPLYGNHPEFADNEVACFTKEAVSDLMSYLQIHQDSKS